MAPTVRHEVLATSGAARRGRLHTPHGVVDTPAFMPVGTGGSVKALLPEEVASTGSQIILGNTFHLMIRPGHDVIERLGGLHKFGGWSGPILTDSGGFQVFSLKELAKITEEGVRFKSPYDGSQQDLSPERSIEVQEALGVDIAMAFDECPPHDADQRYMKRSMDRTTRWLDRCIAARKKPEQTSLFGIVQGGRFEDMREEHAAALIERDLDGYAIGGVAVGEDKDVMVQATQFTAKLLPADKPRYLMGVGLPEDLVRSVIAGVDMFDCVIPTRNARMGRIWTSHGLLVVKNSKNKEDGRPLDDNCACPTCAKFSRAYIRHLWMTRELLAHRLTTMHNVWFFQNLMRRIREEIPKDGLQSLLAEALRWGQPEPS